jgi:hypothetical protein
MGHFGGVFADYRYLRGQERARVRTAQEAANVLMKDFPLDDGEEFLCAVRACLDAMAGKIEPEEFRQAIIRAADEAGITAIAVLH